eukprot:gnl/Hemi2/21902_TR7314_c0_g1_i1.p1 gnl/Hemi2/21902_TR7314_c0_g1~~gnl/Hemi2/21902_TR7314_c0_g1_i1.p1  ORF type:complete len:472 (+),score=143.82 gnl/Hemi2/21902_TR7314_c0_g1_i1:109-1524(+)
MNAFGWGGKAAPQQMDEDEEGDYQHNDDEEEEERAPTPASQAGSNAVFDNGDDEPEEEEAEEEAPPPAEDRTPRKKTAFNPKSNVPIEQKYNMLFARYQELEKGYDTMMDDHDMYKKKARDLEKRLNAAAAAKEENASDDVKAYRRRDTENNAKIEEMEQKITAQEEIIRKLKEDKKKLLLDKKKVLQGGGSGGGAGKAPEEQEEVTGLKETITRQTALIVRLRMERNKLRVLFKEVHDMLPSNTSGALLKMDETLKDLKAAEDAPVARVVQDEEDDPAEGPSKRKVQAYVDKLTGQRISGEAPPGERKNLKIPPGKMMSELKKVEKHDKYQFVIADDEVEEAKERLKTLTSKASELSKIRIMLQMQGEKINEEFKQMQQEKVELMAGLKVISNKLPLLAGPAHTTMLAMRDDKNDLLQVVNSYLNEIHGKQVLLQSKMKAHDPIYLETTRMEKKSQAGFRSQAARPGLTQ